MKALIACEESQRVCMAFRELGHAAFSCDILPCSGNHEEWHIQGDVLPLLNGHCKFKTMDGVEHEILGKWDIIIAFPPCTYLTVAGNRWFNVERYGSKAIQRYKDREQAIKFFMRFVNADCDRIAIENPVGIMSTVYRKPEQIVQPWMFSHCASKGTCLWLKNLPKLVPTDIVQDINKRKENQQVSPDGRLLGIITKDDSGKILAFNNPETAKIRSKTFPGIAKAMAIQWSSALHINSCPFYNCDSCAYSCPKLNPDYYYDCGMSGITLCSECPYNRGCVSCDFFGTEYCHGSDKIFKSN